MDWRSERTGFGLDLHPDFDFVTIPAKDKNFLMGSPKGEPKRWINEDRKDGEQIVLVYKVLSLYNLSNHY